MTISAPEPSVVHLVTIFRRITAGQIRIPAFQRQFVWSNKQMIELLESVSAGEPIGSLLLWIVENRLLRIAPTENTAFPDVEEKFPANYVLDGMQRLSTLYGVFHFGQSTFDKRFSISYDLEGLRFYHVEDEVQPLELSLPLSSLFVPRELLQHQGRLSALDNGEMYIDRLLAMQASFQEYMIPAVTIRGDDVGRIVRIFERINSTGTRLDPVDFMRAITWAEDFDLNNYLDRARELIANFGFTLSDETVIKCVGLLLNIPPTTAGLLDLRRMPSNELMEAFDRLPSDIENIALFLLERFNISSSDFIPYEGQLLILFKAIAIDKAEPLEQEGLARWFWASGFNESLRGKPDHYVVRAIEDWRGLIEGKIRGLEPRLKLTRDELLERRYVEGRALTISFACLYANVKPFDFVSGQEIKPLEFLSAVNRNHFVTILGREQLVRKDGDLHSLRVFSNLLLVNEFAREFASGGFDLVQNAIENDKWNLLASHFISKPAAELFLASDFAGFLRERANEMHTAALRFVGVE